jgi:hypothetical protein
MPWQSPLRRDDLTRRIDKIAQRLPPDGGVRIEHPVHHGHGPEATNPHYDTQDPRCPHDAWVES